MKKSKELGFDIERLYNISMKLDLDDSLKRSELDIHLKQIYFYLDQMNQHELHEDSPDYINLIEKTKKMIAEIESRKSEFQKTSKVIKPKREASQTNYEIAIALHYLVYKANSNLELNKNKLIELLYYLRKETPKSTIENTTEYNQYKDVFGNDESRKVKLLRTHGTKAAIFLESLGLKEVAMCIRKDIE
jgi:hypothetical protein